MFTGLVREIGPVSQSFPNREGRVMRIRSQKLLPQMEIGDSVAINGVCQTVTRIGAGEFEVQVVPATLKKTTLGTLGPGDSVNLELALTLQDRLGGHWLQGHINGAGTILQIQGRGETYWLTLGFSPPLGKYMVQEGPLGVDGVSLTIAQYQPGGRELALAVVPHTWQHTTLKDRRVGDKVNLEVDILAKYVENLAFYGDNSRFNVDNSTNNVDKPVNNVDNSGNSLITKEFLREKGFL